MYSSGSKLKIRRKGEEKGFPVCPVSYTHLSNGDARAALTAIELGVLTTDRSDDGIIHITIDVASECIQTRVISHDKKGDNHYDTISAFIKSMRGSDPVSYTHLDVYKRQRHDKDGA